jgi:hypothetical protein
LIERQVEAREHATDARVALPLIVAKIRRPSETTSNTGRVSSSGASCASRPIRNPGCLHTRPSSGFTSPPTTCNSVDLPVPLRPMTQMRSPASISTLASSSSGRYP